MKFLIAFFMLPAALSAQGNIWLKEPDGFKGLKFGSTEEEFRKAFGVYPKPSEFGYTVLDDCRNNIHDEAEWNLAHHLAEAPKLRNRTCFYRIQVGTFALLTDFDFTDDHLRRVMGTFDPGYFADVKDIFIDTYGAPHSDEQSVVQTQMGARLKQETLSWYGKKMALVLATYSSRIDQGIFTLSMREDLDKERQKQDQANKKALQ
jgi:hypothetical protein